MPGTGTFLRTPHPRLVRVACDGFASQPPPSQRWRHDRASAASPIRSDIPLLRGTSSEGGSVRGSPCDAPARLRSTSLRPPPAAASPGTGDPRRRPPEIHSLRSRHSRAAASAPASLPSLTVPLRVRLGRAPCRMRRIDPLGARPLPERPPGRRPHSAPPSCGCYAPYRGPLAQRGVPRSGLWSEVQFRRAEPAASGRKVASVAEGNPPRVSVLGSVAAITGLSRQ